jgi:hypothetical protein
MKEPHVLDGNAAAGDLARVFGSDITAAMGTCDGCHHRAAVAELTAYVDGPGVVLRCPGCTQVLLRIVTTPTTTWLQMPGLRSLEIAMEP